MLIISRREGESLQVGRGVLVTVNALSLDRVQLVVEPTQQRQIDKLIAEEAYLAAMSARSSSAQVERCSGGGEACLRQDDDRCSAS